MLFEKFCCRFHVYQQLTVSRIYIRNSENSFCTGTKKKKKKKEAKAKTKTKKKTKTKTSKQNNCRRSVRKMVVRFKS